TPAPAPEPTTPGSVGSTTPSCRIPPAPARRSSALYPTPAAVRRDRKAALAPVNSSLRLRWVEHAAQRMQPAQAAGVVAVFRIHLRAAFTKLFRQPGQHRAPISHHVSE